MEKVEIQAHEAGKERQRHSNQVESGGSCGNNTTGGLGGNNRLGLLAATICLRDSAAGFLRQEVAPTKHIQCVNQQHILAASPSFSSFGPAASFGNPFIAISSSIKGSGIAINLIYNLTDAVNRKARDFI